MQNSVEHLPVELYQSCIFNRLNFFDGLGMNLAITNGDRL